MPARLGAWLVTEANSGGAPAGGGMISGAHLLPDCEAAAAADGRPPPCMHLLLARCVWAPLSLLRPQLAAAPGLPPLPGDVLWMAIWKVIVQDLLLSGAVSSPRKLMMSRYWDNDGAVCTASRMQHRCDSLIYDVDVQGRAVAASWPELHV